MILHWIAHFFGLDNGSGHFYLFWSGFGSDITELAIVAAVWHGVNCHEDGCWRIGTRMTVEDNGHHFRRCKKHHKERHV